MQVVVEENRLSARRVDRMECSTLSSSKIDPGKRLQTPRASGQRSIQTVKKRAGSRRFTLRSKGSCLLGDWGQSK